MTVECIVTKGSAVVSSQTSQAEVQSLIDRAVKLGDPKLAADIRQFASTRQYGLVFEHNRPERMRLYGKPVTARDVVCFASMFVRQVRQCFSAVWADGFPRCRHRFPVM